MPWLNLSMKEPVMKINTLYNIFSNCLGSVFLKGFALVLVLLFCSSALNSQIISIEANDDTASEAGLDAGSFRIYNTGTLAGDITVEYSISGSATNGADYATLTGSVNLTGGNNTEVFVDISVIDDSLVEGVETVTLQLTNASGETINSAQDTDTVTILDNDASVSFSTASSSAMEDVGNNLPTLIVNGTVVDAASSITLTTTGSTATVADYTLASTTITIPPGTYSNTVISLGLSITPDAIAEVDETVVLGFGAISGDIVTTVNPASSTYTILNDDVAGVTVTPISGNTNEAGGTATFDIVLNTQPTANVTIPLSSNDTSEGVLAVTNVVFTTANWNSPQTVIVTGVNDDVADGNTIYAIVTGNVTSPDAVYNALTATNVADVSVTNEDNDVVGVTVSAISGNTTEAGGTAFFTVVLDSEPTANVTIPLSSNDTSEGILAVANVVFTPGNWNVAQTITVTGVEDALVDGDIAYTIITGNVNSADAGYNTLTAANVADVSVTNTDNDAVGVTVSTISGNTTEAGGTATFTLVLDSQPTANVTIPLSSDDTSEGVIAVANVVFTPGNWNVAQTVTVSGVDDSIVDGDIDFNIITGNVTSADSGYNALTAASVADVEVTNLDNDAFGVTVSTISGNTTEAGGTANFTLVLDSQPTANVTIPLSSDNTAEGALAVNSVVFTPGNWNVAQTVTVTGVDDFVADGDISYTIVTGNVSSADTGYNALTAANVADVSVSNVDDDAVGVTVSAISGNTTEAGGTATFSLVLDSQPTANVTIPLSSNNTAEGTLAVTNVVFTPGNWNVAQTVTVTGVDDIVVDGDISYAIVTGNVTSSDTAYDALNAGSVGDVSVVNIDDDTAGISISDVTVNEGDGTATFTVILNRGVLFGTSVKYETANNTASAGSDYVSQSGTLNFLGLNGETKTIVIDILEDVIAEGTEEFFVNLSNATGFAQIAKAQGVGTITDNDNCIEAPLINDTSTIFCAAFTQDLDAYTDTTIPAGFELIWSSNSDFSVTGARLNTSIIDFEATFYGFLYNEGTGCVSPPLEVTLVRNEPPEILNTTPTTICGPGIATISATVSAGGSLFWYASESSVDSLEEGSSFSTSVSGTTTYYVEAFANGCFSEREAVIVTVNDLVDPGTTTATSACSLSGGGAATTIDLDTTRSGGDTGVWSIVGTPPSTVTIGADNIVDFEGVVDGDYIFRFTTDSAVSPCVDESVDVTISVTTCTMDSDGDSIIDRDEIALGLDPNDPDTDGDGIDDGAEVGPDVSNPIDTDNDGIIDALDSNILDSDNDGVVDQLDPANDNPCIPNISDACQIDLGIEKVVDRESVLVGREVVFTVTLTNLSQIMVTNVAVNDLVSPATGFQYVSSSSSKGIYDPVAGVWQLDEVLADEVNTLTITVIVPEVGAFQNTAAIVDSFPEDSNAANNIASATVEVTPRSTNECGFLFNQISPNGDEYNDAVVINCIEQYPNNTLQIFDRYGNEVFSVNGYDNSWMGTGKNGDLPKGTYFYILDLGDGTEVRKGWIQIIR